jgi:tetratricopeptide (TPR) repeat protein
MKPAYIWGLVLALAAAQAPAQNAMAKQRAAALELEKQGKVAEAEDAWAAMSRAYPNNPEPYARMGVIEAHREHYDKAVPLYRKALKMNPNVPGLRLNLALALFKGGQMKASIPEFQILLKSLPPDSPDAERCTVLLGMAHYGLGQYADAVPYLKAAAVRDTTNLPLRLALAHSCLWSKQLQCVMNVYHEILTLNSESAEADMLAGEALDEMKDNEGSTKMFRAAVAANPKEPDVHFGLGYLLWTQKQYPEAASEFQAELANDPAHAQSMLYLGDTELQLNKPEEARPLLEKALKADPTQWLVHLDLGILASDAGRNDEALRELETAAKLKPNEVNVHWRLGRLYRAMGRKDEAKAEFDKASQLNKAADEDLYQKIANGQKRGRAGGAAPAPATAPNP